MYRYLYILVYIYIHTHKYILYYIYIYIESPLFTSQVYIENSTAIMGAVFGVSSDPGLKPSYLLTIYIVFQIFI